MTSRRVALVTSSYHPHVGGVEEHVRRVALDLTRRGHDVVVWTVDRGEHLGVRDVDGIEVRYLPTPLPARSMAGVRRVLADGPSAIAAWRRAYRSFRPDVLHVQCFGPNGTYATLLARVTGTPLVISSHGETFADDHAVFDRSRLARRALGYGMRHACAITGCSQLVLTDLARFDPRGGSVVPNGIDLAAPVPPRVPADPPYVLAYGRVEHNKGFDLLLEAFARAPLPARTRLVLGGDGGALPALRRQAGALGLEDRVDFAGQLSRAQVSAELAAASVVVVPSRREAFGLVVLEAWQAGAPLVVTSRGGPAGLVTDGVDALVADPEDAADLGNAILRVLSEPGLADRLARAGHREVRRFSWDQVSAAYESLYDGCG